MSKIYTMSITIARSTNGSQNILALKLNITLFTHLDIFSENISKIKLSNLKLYFIFSLKLLGIRDGPLIFKGRRGGDGSFEKKNSCNPRRKKIVQHTTET